ncbi:MAG: UDP-phosphate glucose phosphotransferase [Candidatus Peregrinibacteria bacterium GW2011_GWE2_39_6]|nr:MAG: UDP-phosphate glucose phosphotransferase [Candidatus Peregrinibacteria bacterium GW2011_GWF2_39_17]KKR25523.1 MAG: UDP-phosphate glucose phosphotransferase [Candidatus Peregrinibacteria bacterium GW2011_GWE2_39_6]HCW31967.1 hypothetical protein [Candidatus Peregrinibacteria bacterium]
MKTLTKILDQNIFSVLILMLSDLLWMVLAFVSAYYLRNNLLGAPIQLFTVYAQALPVVILILILTFYFFGLYERGRRLTPFSELYHLVRAITLVWLFIMAASFLYKYDYSRGFVLLFYGCSLFTLILGRYVIRRIYQSLYKKGIGVTRILIVGAGESGKSVANKLKKYATFGYQIIGFLDKRAPDLKGFPYLGAPTQLLSLIQKHHIQEVFIADQNLSHEDILDLIHRCDKTEVKFKILSDLFEIVTGEIDLNELEGLPSLDLKKTNSTFLYKISKRIIDLIFSGAALILLSPFWFFIVVGIRFESKGPAIFSHLRVGKNGKIFTIYKFRTMFIGSSPNNYAPKSSSDARITKFGRFLRRTSLDEIPQFWNVLKGEMSIVGPRPEMPFIVNQYRDWQRRRLDVKPGITGLWQILGRKDLPLHENIEYDFYYIKNQSLLLDITIIIKTVTAVLKGKGAY